MVYQREKYQATSMLYESTIVQNIVQTCNNIKNKFHVTIASISKRINNYRERILFANKYYLRTFNTTYYLATLHALCGVCYG